MIRIKKNPQKKPAKDVMFDSPETNEKLGIGMLISLNIAGKTVLTGPDVGVDAKILVTKERPHFFFNPCILDPKSLQSNTENSTIAIQYKDFQGTDTQITMADDDGEIRSAIDRLHNGIKRAQRTKKV